MEMARSVISLLQAVNEYVNQASTITRQWNMYVYFNNHDSLLLPPQKSIPASKSRAADPYMDPGPTWD